MTVNFEDRKRKMNNNNAVNSTLEGKWDNIDADAAARGAAIVMNGSTDFGNLNYSFTANKDVEEFRKQASLHAKLFEQLHRDPKTREAAYEVDRLLEEMELSGAGELTEEDIKEFEEE